MKLTSQKHLFDIPEDVSYLNIAALSPSFKAIEEAGVRSVMQKNRPYLTKVSDFFDPVKELRELCAQLIDVDDPDRIATIPSVSYGLANVANNITLKNCDEIILVDEQFPSNYYIWKKLVDSAGAKLKIVKPTQNSVETGKNWNQSILNAINKNTAVVAMGQVHWSNGTLFDLEAIRSKTKENNSLLIIDGSQSIGAYPFSVNEIQPDALVCAGYKWLFGPYGGAFAYYGPYFDNGTPIEESWINRKNSENFAGLTEYQAEYKPLANRYSAGQSGSFIYVQMRIAGIKQVLKWQPKRIQEFCRELTQEPVQQLKALGCAIEDDSSRSHHMFGVGLPDSIDVQKLRDRFAEEKIFVSFRGSYMRLSCHLFSTPKDFERLIECLKSVLES